MTRPCTIRKAGTTWTNVAIWSMELTRTHCKGSVTVWWTCSRKRILKCHPRNVCYFPQVDIMGGSYVFFQNQTSNAYKTHHGVNHMSSSQILNKQCASTLSHLLLSVSTGRFSKHVIQKTKSYIDGLVQERRNPVRLQWSYVFLH